MDMPTVKKLLLPTLKCLEDRAELRHAQLIDRVADLYGLSEEQRQVRNSSGKQRKIYGLVTLAAVHLRKAGLAKSPSRGITRITQRGLDLLTSDPPGLSFSYLKKTYPEYEEFDKKGSKARKAKAAKKASEADWRATAMAGTAGYNVPLFDDPTRAGMSLVSGTPEKPLGWPHPVQETPPLPAPKRKYATQLEKTLEHSARSLQKALESAVEERVSTLSPEQLGRIMLILLARMGYGEADAENGSTASLQEGAIIKDALGLNQVYAQVLIGKNAEVSDLQRFTGAFETAHAERGIFVSPGGFTGQARGFALGSAKRIRLMDASDLAKLMVANGVGVVVHARYAVKQIDRSYFERLYTAAA